ncbi:ATP-grasp domain-containing protein [Cetobacterium sp.]|uniref:ATP-grasp domain-containing protein n=1 Tax=Cetobacterium sp. TaxID=2071632 RepID=UPI003AEFB7A0
MKKILLLGGSKQQIVAIECAKKMGYYTILCDYLEDNPGQQYADKFYLVSTTDKEKILEIAKKEKINGIVAYASDPAAPTAAYVAEKLELPTNPYESVKILTNKDLFRKFLEDNGFKTPKAKGYSSVDEIKDEIKDFKFPLIIKPVDSSGSKGVAKVESIKELNALAENALRYSLVKRFIIEEFVEMFGYQVAGDGFVIDGELVFRCFANDHFDKKSINPFVPISASFPYNMPQETQNKIHQEIQRALSLLNMKMGAYNFDIRIDKDMNVYLMEIGPRNGGNFIPQIIKYATGVDLIENTIKQSLGEKIEKMDIKDYNGFYSYYAIHSSKAGILKNIEISKKIKESSILESHLNYKVGDSIPAFVGANGCLGILLMKFETMEEMLDLMDNADKWIEVILKEEE